jgi:hypothetical protein
LEDGDVTMVVAEMRHDDRLRHCSLLWPSMTIMTKATTDRIDEIESPNQPFGSSSLIRFIVVAQQDHHKDASSILSLSTEPLHQQHAQAKPKQQLDHHRNIRSSAPATAPTPFLFSRANRSTSILPCH